MLLPTRHSSVGDCVTFFIVGVPWHGSETEKAQHHARALGFGWVDSFTLYLRDLGVDFGDPGVRSHKAKSRKAQLVAGPFGIASGRLV